MGEGTLLNLGMIQILTLDAVSFLSEIQYDAIECAKDTFAETSECDPKSRMKIHEILH